MKNKTYSAPSVKKAFKILHAIADSSTGLGVSELSSRVGIGKSTVLGITSALEEMGILIRDSARKKYSVGYTLLELCRKAYARMELRDVARIPMEALTEKVGESVYLGVLNGEHVTILEVVESHNEMKITSPPGTRLPLLTGATGRVLLAQLEDKKAREIVHRLGLVRYTANSVTDPRQFLREMAEARQKGYAIDDEEYMIGVRAIAAPVQSASFPPAAIWVVGFTSSLDDQKMEKVVQEIEKTARKISHSLKPS